MLSLYKNNFNDISSPLFPPQELNLSGSALCHSAPLPLPHQMLPLLNNLTKMHPNVNTAVLVLRPGVPLTRKTPIPIQIPRLTSHRTKKRRCFSSRINFILLQQQSTRISSLLTLFLYHLSQGLKTYRHYQMS